MITCIFKWICCVMNHKKFRWINGCVSKSINGNYICKHSEHGWRCEEDVYHLCWFSFDEDKSLSLSKKKKVEVCLNQKSKLFKSLDVEVKYNLIMKRGIQCQFILYKALGAQKSSSLLLH